MNVLAVKAAVRERDGYCCVRCGMTNDQHVARYGKALQVHRLVPRSRYTLEGAITVCCPCHGPLPKAEPGTPDPYHNGCPLNVWIRTGLDDALNALLSDTRPRTTKTAVVELALEEYLRGRGYLPESTEEPD